MAGNPSVVGGPSPRGALFPLHPLLFLLYVLMEIVLDILGHHWTVKDMMYGKAFESMYSGSMIGSGLNVFAVWNYAITKAKCGIVELNPKLLFAILGGPMKEIESAITFLTQPDPESRSKAEDGRRLIREGQFQYRVVNWAAYQGIKNAQDLTEYNRIKKAEYRAKQKALKSATKKGPSPGERGYVNAADRGDHDHADKLTDPGMLREEPAPYGTATAPE